MVSGMAAFARPAVFRLERDPDGFTCLSTNAGAVLDEAWLGGAIRRVAAQTLEGAWEELAPLARTELPEALVQAWQARNEREMVAFRLWT
jgi:hypothetical protein